MALPTGHETGRTSAQPFPGLLVVARHLVLSQLQLQLFRLLRHGVTLSGHVVGTAGKEGEEISVEGNCHEQHNSSD